MERKGGKVAKRTNIHVSSRLYTVKDSVPQYLVKWKGSNEETWEPCEHLSSSCAELVSEYYASFHESLVPSPDLKELKVYLYNIQVPNPTLQIQTMKLAKVLHLKEGTEFLTFKQVYGDEMKRIFVRNHEATQPASGCNLAQFGIAPIRTTVKKLLPEAVNDKVLTISKEIDNAVMHCTEDLLIIPVPLKKEINTAELFTLKKEKITETTTNTILSTVLEPHLETVGLKVWSQTESLYKGFCKFASSKPDLCIYQRADDDKIESLLVLDDEDNMVNLFGIDTECQTGGYTKEKVWQTLAIMLLLATEVTLSELLQSKIVKTVTIYGLSVNYKLKTANALKLFMDFEKKHLLHIIQMILF